VIVESTARDDAPRELTTTLAVAIEPDRLVAGIVTIDGDVLIRDRVTTPGRDVWRSLETLVLRVLAAWPDGRGRPSAVGASCIGPVDVQAGSVSPSSVRVWSAFPLRERLEAMTGLPVVVGSSAAAIAEVEWWLGDGPALGTYVTVLCDEVIESACMVEGRLLGGQHGNAGSIAHVIVDPDGLECWCGAMGCVAPYVSSSSLEAEMSRSLARARPAIIERAGIMLGRGMAALATTLDVTTFMVSGRVIDTFGDPMMDVARAELGRRARLGFASGATVVEPSGFAGSLLGAAALARRSFGIG
jgi:glucokinase